MKNMGPKVSRTRVSGQKGNTIVESAFVMIPLFAIIFGIADFGLMIFMRSSLQHAVREGVRYAVTYQTKDGMGHDASIKAVVQEQAMGFLNNEESLESLVIRYYDPSTMQEVANNAPGNLIEVSVENYVWGWLAPFLRSASPLYVTVRSSDRMEGLPGGVSPPAR